MISSPTGSYLKRKNQGKSISGLSTISKEEVEDVALDINNSMDDELVIRGERADGFSRMANKKERFLTTG